MPNPLMRGRFESWLGREWQRNSPWQLLLRPISWLFRLLVAVRRASFQIGLSQRRRVGVPVLIVGNITVGGSGKTPLVIALVETLRARGFSPGVVSRGYAASAGQRRGEAPREVDADAADAAARCGDEPLLLARRLHCPVFVGRDRAAAAIALLAAHPGVNLIIGDDGLQHYGLARDIEIAVIDGSYGVGNGEMLPAGPLREPAARLQGVDALAIYGSGRRVGDDSLMSFAITLGAERFVNLHSGQQLDLGGFLALAGGKPLQAVAGIARPERFFAHLHRLGLRTIDHPFADHHAFSAADLAFAEHDLLLMTEKDAVKCASFAHPGWWVLQVDALLPAAFYELILRRLGQLPGAQKALNPRKKSHEP